MGLSSEEGESSAPDHIRNLIRMTANVMIDFYGDDDDEAAGTKEEIMDEIELLVANSSNGVFRVEKDILKELLK